MRIIILNPSGKPQGSLDNDAPGAIHYCNDKLHTYLQGSASIFEFTAQSDHADSDNLVVGNKIAFIDDETAYYMTIMSATQNEYEIQVMAMSLALELINEAAGADEKPSSGKTIEWYISKYVDVGSGHTIEYGNNQIPDSRTRKLEWTDSTQTVLARLYDIASSFNAELEFVTELKNDYSLKKLVLNIYKKHSDSNQGIGKNRRNRTLRYGVDIEGITKATDITQLYSAIKPTGTDEEGNKVRLGSMTNAAKDASVVNDEDGNTLYYSPYGSGTLYNQILAPQTRMRFPSTVSKKDDKYITYEWSTQVEGNTTAAKCQNLYDLSLEKLKELSEPKVTYTIKGYSDLCIGDTVRIADDAFEPPLYLDVRVTEQQISFTDPTKNTTTFDNAVELESEISPSLLSQVKDLQNKTKIAQETADEAVIEIASQQEYFYHEDADPEIVGSVASTNITTDPTASDAHNVKIDANGMYIRTGETVNASFSGNEILLGNDYDESSISLCDGLFRFYCEHQEGELEDRIGHIESEESLKIIAFLASLSGFAVMLNATSFLSLDSRGSVSIQAGASAPEATRENIYIKGADVKFDANNVKVNDSNVITEENGLYRILSSAISDLNDLLSGSAYIESGTSNTPTTNQTYIAFAFSSSNGRYTVQLATRAASSNFTLYMRKKVSGSWGSWKSITFA